MVGGRPQFRTFSGQLAPRYYVNLEKSGTQSHSSIGIGERYQKLLRKTYRELKCDHLSALRQLLLALPVKAMNDTLRPEGTAFSVQVFGEYPGVRAFEGLLIPRSSLAECAEVALEARR